MKIERKATEVKNIGIEENISEPRTFFGKNRIQIERITLQFYFLRLSPTKNFNNFQWHRESKEDKVGNGIGTYDHQNQYSSLYLLCNQLTHHCNVSFFSSKYSSFGDLIIKVSEKLSALKHLGFKGFFQCYLVRQDTASMGF